MATYLYDVERLEGTETGLHFAMRNKQDGLSTDTFKLIHKYEDGTVKKWVSESSLTYGQTGIQGPRGVTGPAGLGDTGETGVGIQGATGVDGITGLIGETGAQGLTGLSLQGVTGLIGVTGLGGSDGSQGVTGAQGVAGSQGAQGVTGLIGFTGAQGATGALAPDSVGATGVFGYVPYFDSESHISPSKIRRVNANYLAIDCSLSVTGLIQGGVTVQYGDMMPSLPDAGIENNTTGGTWYTYTGMYSHLLNETTFSGNKLIAAGAGVYYASYSLSVSASDETVFTRIRVYHPDTTELFLVPGVQALGTPNGYEVIAKSGLIPCKEGSTVELQYSTQSDADLFLTEALVTIFRLGAISI